MTRPRGALEADLAKVLAPARLPEDRAAAIRQALWAAAAHVPARPQRRRWMVVAAAALLLAPAALLWQASRVPRLQPAGAGEPPSTFERLALELHERGADAALPAATLLTTSAHEARAWARAHTGVDVHLPAARPAADDGRFELRGVAAAEHRGAHAAAVFYAVDGRPVTLAVARASERPDDMPAWTLAAKRIRSRAVSGHNLLSWTNDGQSYVLVADLPGDVRRGCFVCHTQPARRRVIDRLAP
jgi:hypothetical protein